MEMEMKRNLIAILFTASFAIAPPLAVSQIQTAKVSGGEVQGLVSDGISIFKGIPFAAPPVGELRWKSPEPVQPWSGVKKADAFGLACMQARGAMGNSSNVSEDCLYLNVWTPARKPGEKIPVIVWIYGGAFSGGSTSTPMYDGLNFAKKGVVLVSVAYRVGAFGFLAHPELSRESDGRGSGNYGLADMIAGLKWVKENVSRFGGDPSNVTIFGHSAGGMAVSMLAASPQTKGLFHRAICMSGGSFAPLQTSNETGTGMGIPALAAAESRGEAFLKKLGAADIKAARALSAEDIQKSLAGGMGGGGFRPVADGYIVPSDLYSLYQAGRFNDTPILVGNTSDEAASMMRGKVTAVDFQKQIKSQYGPHADAILSVYPHSTDAEAAKASRGVMRESTFSWNTWTWARLQSQKGKGKAFEYFFDHHPPTSDGAGHGSDVPYAFQTLSTRQGSPKQEDVALSDMISSYWVNFAKTGDPNGPGLPKWPAFTERDQKVIVFDAAPSARPVPNLDKLKAFDAYISWRRAEAK
jgi:para-nitrobenzyl esterase